MVTCLKLSQSSYNDYSEMPYTRTRPLIHAGRMSQTVSEKVRSACITLHIILYSHGFRRSLTVDVTVKGVQVKGWLCPENSTHTNVQRIYDFIKCTYWNYRERNKFETFNECSLHVHSTLYAYIAHSTTHHFFVNDVTSSIRTQNSHIYYMEWKNTNTYGIPLKICQIACMFAHA